MQNQDDPVTVAHVLFPVSLVAFVLFVLLAFQCSSIMHDRQEMVLIRSQQQTPVEQAQRVQAQVSALIAGTMKLAEGGNKEAQAIVKRLDQLGITGKPASPDTASGAQSPATPTPLPAINSP